MSCSLVAYVRVSTNKQAEEGCSLGAHPVGKAQGGDAGIVHLRARDPAAEQELGQFEKVARPFA